MPRRKILKHRAVRAAFLRRLAEEAEKASSIHDLRAIVVNLDRRKDRLEACSKKLREHCAWLHFDRFRATDGRADAIADESVTRSWNTASNVVYQKQRAIRKGWDDLDSYQVKTLQHSPGERGCSMSHIRAWKHCLEQAGTTDRPLMVLEDDALPMQNFTEVLTRAMRALPSDAHVLYLGYSQAANWRREVSPELVEAEYVWTTVAYIIWPAGARLLLSLLPVDQPVDNFMASACARGLLRSYCIRPKIVHQAEAWNVNSDVGHSDEAGPSDVPHSDLFYPGLPGDGNGGVATNLLNGVDSDTSDDEEL